MKSAKKEAQSLIDSYRAEKEAAYQSSMQKTMGSSGSEADALRKETDKAIAQIQGDFDANMGKVKDMLVKEVTKVTLRVPEARKINSMKTRN
jgi:vacuolar-type H+-ATPase subunit H